MVKKVLLLSPVLLGLLLVELGGQSSEDAAAQLEQAETYKQNGQYEQAEAIYRGIVTDYPGTDEAFQAQKNLALLCIMTAKYPAARQEVDALITNFADHPELPGEVYKIAEQYWRRKRYEDVKPLYEYIAENHSDSDLAIKARTWVARADIWLGNDAAAQAGIDGLIAEFADHPELPGEVYKIEAQYWRMKRFEDVKLLCEYIAENHSDSDLAIKARTSVPAADILLGNYAAAQAGIDALIRDFAEDPELARMIWKLGIVSWIGERYDWSRQFYQRVVDTWPESSYAKRSRIGIIRTDIKLGGDPNVLAGVDELIADFADHPELPGEVYELAYDCRLLKRYEDARQLWQRVVDNCPDSNDMIVMRSRIGIITLDINLGDNPSALAGVDELIANFYGHPRLCQAVWRIGEQYYYKAFEDPKRCVKVKSEEHLKKAKEIWERVVAQWPESQSIGLKHAYYFSAVCYRRMGEYAKAVTYSQKVVDDWPDYKYAWSAQYLIGNCYEKLRNSGSLPESEANLKIEQAYEAVVEKYPDCSLAAHACLKLGQINLEKGQRVVAAEFFKLFLEMADPADPRIESVKARLEELGGQNK